MYIYQLHIQFSFSYLKEVMESSTNCPSLFTSPVSTSKPIVPKLKLNGYNPPTELSPSTLEDMKKVAFAMEYGDKLISCFSAEFDGILWRPTPDYMDEARAAHLRLQYKLGTNYTRSMEYKKIAQDMSSQRKAENNIIESPTQSKSLNLLFLTINNNNKQ